MAFPPGIGVIAVEHDRVASPSSKVSASSLVAVKAMGRYGYRCLEARAGIECESSLMLAIQHTSTCSDTLSKLSACVDTWYW